MDLFDGRPATGAAVDVLRQRRAFVPPDRILIPRLTDRERIEFQRPPIAVPTSIRYRERSVHTFDAEPPYVTS